MKDYFCGTCHENKHLDEMACTDAEICEECHEKWLREQTAYWKPLYDAELRWKLDDDEWKGWHRS